VLVPPEDVNALGEALLGLVQGPGAPRSLGAAARTRVAAFSLDAMVEAYVRLWRASVPVRA
jgi:glycosyltransferase involved in cell wall biosynthesis